MWRGLKGSGAAANWSRASCHQVRGSPTSRVAFMLFSRTSQYETTLSTLGPASMASRATGDRRPGAASAKRAALVSSRLPVKGRPEGSDKGRWARPNPEASGFDPPSPQVGPDAGAEAACKAVPPDARDG